VKCRSSRANAADVAHKAPDSNIDVVVPSWHDSTSWRHQRTSDWEQQGHCVTSCAETHHPTILSTAVVTASQ